MKASKWRKRLNELHFIMQSRKKQMYLIIFILINFQVIVFFAGSILPHVVDRGRCVLGRIAKHLGVIPGPPQSITKLWGDLFMSFQASVW